MKTLPTTQGFHIRDGHCIPSSQQPNEIYIGHVYNVFTTELHEIYRRLKAGKRPKYLHYKNKPESVWDLLHQGLLQLLKYEQTCGPTDTKHDHDLTRKQWLVFEWITSCLKGSESQTLAKVKKYL